MKKVIEKKITYISGPSDSQIALDVPRCHQYNDLLSSPDGQVKLKNVLRAWTKYNPHLSYWQGVDSLCAPFLVLNFNDEAKAFFCLHNVVEKYLHSFFDSSEQNYLTEYLIR